MTNPHYTPTAQPTSFSRGRSQTIRDEYGLIEAGFDSVEAAMGLLAPKASPTFTGTATFASITVGSGATVDMDAATTVTVPTEANVSDSTTKAASTAFVQAVLGAGGALLPPQSTHNGKYLYTNGTSASWELVNIIDTGKNLYERTILQNNSTYTNVGLVTLGDVYASPAISRIARGSVADLFVGFLTTSTDTCYTSPDGVTWTARTLPSSSTWYNAFTYYGNTIIVHATGATSAYSTNGGVTWTAKTLPTSLAVLVSGNSVACFSASGSATYYTSTDSGANWTSRTTPSAANRSITTTQLAICLNLGSNRLLLPGGQSYLLISSDNGVTWTEAGATGWQDNVAWDGVAGSSATLIGVGANTWDVNYTRSTNGGSTWTALAFGGTDVMWGCTYGNGVFVVVGYDTSNSRPRAATSATGASLSWTYNDVSTTTPHRLYSVEWNGSLFMAVGENGACYTSTTGGAPWSLKTDPTGLTRICSQVVWDSTNSKWVVYSSQEGKFYYSSNDGTSWTTGATQTCNRFWLMNGKLFLTAGAALKQSTDSGATWTDISGPTSSGYGLVWNGTYYFVRGTGGQLWRCSSDFTKRALVVGPFTSSGQYMRSCSGAILAFGNSCNMVGYSTDGINWSYAETGFTWNNTNDKWVRGEVTGTYEHYCAADGKWYRTSNGSTWTSEACALSPDANVPYKINGVFLSANDGAAGVPTPWLVSDDAGATWKSYQVAARNEGLNNQYSYTNYDQIAVSPSKFISIQSSANYVVISFTQKALFFK